MKVTSLETYFLSAPLPQAVRTSTHRITSVSEVIVRLSTDAGLMGIGEAHGPFLFQQERVRPHRVQCAARGTTGNNPAIARVGGVRISSGHKASFTSS